jgi:hypothetical protein
MEISNAYRNRWRRTWRSRAAVTGAGVIGIVAGAGAIAATNPASSGASTPTPRAVTPTASKPVTGDDLQRYLFGDDGGRGVDPDGDNWSGGRSFDDDDDHGWQPQQVVPQQQWQPQPQTRTRGS